MKALLPYLDDFWRATVEERGINSLETVTYPPNAPLTSRPQFRDRNGRAATAAPELAAQVCDRWHAGIAICNCLYGVGLLFSEWRQHSRARSTTGLPRNGSTAIRACAARSLCRCRTRNMPWTRSSAAPRM